MRRTAAERRVLSAITYARMMVPNYGDGSFVTGLDRDKLLEFSRVKIIRGNYSEPAVLVPPFAGSRWLFVARWLPSAVVRYLELHECGHCLAGDADEPTVLHFQGPMPEAEEVADLFALSALITDIDAEQGTEWVETRIRELMPFDDKGWQVHRVPELAPKVIRMRKLIKDYL
jgi:hypothetical protein